MSTEDRIVGIKELQVRQKRNQELLAYCKKINLGLENLEARSGERAIWELVQNARDLDENCRIRIELKKDSIVFSHHGKPFDYLSLLALVTQNSSKDDPEKDNVGQYGTGFMTTHAFNETVRVNGPYKVLEDEAGEKHYFVELDDFELKRSYKNGINEAMKEMEMEMESVENMFAKEPKYPSLDIWTSFTYELDSDKIVSVSEQLENVIRLMPMVLVINERIKEIEIRNSHTNKHIRIRKTNDSRREILPQNENWYIVTNNVKICNINENNADEPSYTLKSLQSEKGDIIIIPPYPTSCGQVSTIPSLFLWFPLLGTEQFGTNFIFHSKRFYPVEKRNNILLPEDIQSKLEKGRHNEAVLHEMMQVLFLYYATESNAAELTQEMCAIRFPSETDDTITKQFYKDLQTLWQNKIPNWKIIPTQEGKKAMSNPRVKVLKPEFYEKLTSENKAKYEKVLLHYAKEVKDSQGQPYLLPEERLIEWSEIVNQWDCKRDEFFISVSDVCKVIKNKGDDLHAFLLFLKESGNIGLLENHPLLPNREGNLCIKGNLRHGDFMTTEVYDLVKPLLGSDVERIFDTTYKDICEISSYGIEDLRKAIKNTIDQWRKESLGGSERKELDTTKTMSLMNLCSAFSTSNTACFRARMMPHIARIRSTRYDLTIFPKLTEKEEDFFEPTFNLLLDTTLFHISQKDVNWVKENKTLLHGFATEYASSKDSDRIEQLSKYAILPCQTMKLCLKTELKKNVGVPAEMVEIYQIIKGKNLLAEWVDSEFEELYEFDPVTPESIASEIQTDSALKEEIKKIEKPAEKYRDVLKRIILLLNEDGEWKKWFDDIDKQKEAITFKLQSGDAQKYLFTLMDIDEKKLSDLAEMQKVGKIEDFIESYKQQQEQQYEKEVQFGHLHIIGKHIEDVLRKKLGECVQIEQRNSQDDTLIAEDIQNGQDIIVKLRVNGELENIYYIEVKSKWNFSEPAHMSTNQVRMASQNPDNYALCCVDLRNHRNEELTSLPENIILECTKVKMNIGKELRSMTSEILKADDRLDDEQIKLTDYRSNMSAKVFAQGESFDQLIEKIESIANQKLNNNSKQ